MEKLKLPLSILMLIFVGFAGFRLLETLSNVSPDLTYNVDKSWLFPFAENNKMYYLFINGITILFPFLLSFDRKVAFFKSWKYVFPAILITELIFIAWDIWFTQIGVWGFNESYFYSTLLHLPIGEWLFFITVPYACMFIHACLIAYIKKDFLKSVEELLTIVLILFLGTVALLNLDKAYTGLTFGLTAVFLFLHKFWWQTTWRSRFYLTYIISIPPFYLVNGMLTGRYSEAPVVLYNDAHNLASILGFRFGAIPFDDFVYGFLLLLLNITLWEYFKKHD